MMSLRSGELSPLGARKAVKTKRVFGIIGESLLLGVLFTLVLSVSGQITYDYTRYSTFFVNGMSMYPTLNQDVYRDCRWHGHTGEGPERQRRSL
jgi:hypothetical protein